MKDIKMALLVRKIYYKAISQSDKNVD